MPDQYSQTISPVFAFSAKTSSLPVITYMIPSFTSGEASNEYLPPTPEPFRRVIHAPLSWPTFVVSICLSVEYRWLVRLPPLVIQSLPTGLRSSRSISGSAAVAGAATVSDRARVIMARVERRWSRMACLRVGRGFASLRPGLRPQSPRANPQMTPPCGTSVLVPKWVSIRACIRWASTPHPDCTATYCTPSTMYVLGTPVTPEFVLNSQRTAPDFASNARKFRSLV